MTEIKPCPFCGWGTIVNSGFLNYRCTCNSCGASTKPYPTWELAIEAWNRRVGENNDEPAAQPPLEEFEWCTDCKEYDQKAHCCHRFTKVIRRTVEELNVVRCKDCKWFGDIGCAMQIVDDSDRPSENDFCSFAERKK